MTDQDLPQTPPGGSEILLYQTEDGQSRIQVRLEGGTVWLSQALMADLFQTTPQNITIHLNGIYADGEVDETATCKEFLQVRQEGGRSVQRTPSHPAAFHPALSLALKPPARYTGDSPGL